MIRIPRDANALAIDPGYGRNTGGNACALAERGTLTHVWFERSSDWRDRTLHAAIVAKFAHVIVEQPQQDGRSYEVPPAILIRLAFEGAALAGLYAGASGAQLHVPTVTDWKGNENKAAMHRRLWAVLAPTERDVLGGAKTMTAIDKACERGALCRWSKSGAELYPKSFVTHNLLDAASLLMVALGRLEKVG